MKKLQKKKEFKEMPVEELDKTKRNLELELVKSKVVNHGASPKKGDPTKLTRNIRRQIARVNTIINQKNSIKESIERCKSKPNSKRREKRLNGKMKELKIL